MFFKQCSSVIIKHPREHTMQEALIPYIEMKIHPLIKAFQGETIVVRGKYDRELSIIHHEKTGKKFNWKRPTAELSDNQDTLYLNCFPGRDYVNHYASIIESYLHLRGILDIKVIVELPDERYIKDTLLNTNLMQLPFGNIVILGTVEKLTELTSHKQWTGDGDFCWSTGTVNGKVFTLLGCKFSFWGDISGSIINLLAEKGVETVIYTGKLGGLNKDMKPNQTLATGTTSVIHGQFIDWSQSNPISISETMTALINGAHITVPSVMQETKEWFEHTGNQYDFVDPEIGEMAHAAKQQNIRFGYIHLVSDNVAQVQAEHLGNEREDHIVKKRLMANSRILELLFYNLLKLTDYSYMNLRFFNSLQQQLEAELVLTKSLFCAPSM